MPPRTSKQPADKIEGNMTADGQNFKFTKTGGPSLKSGG